MITDRLRELHPSERGIKSRKERRVRVSEGVPPNWTSKLEGVLGRTVSRIITSAGRKSDHLDKTVDSLIYEVRKPADLSEVHSYLTKNGYVEGYYPVMESERMVISLPFSRRIYVKFLSATSAHREWKWGTYAFTKEKGKWITEYVTSDGISRL